MKVTFTNDDTTVTIEEDSIHARDAVDMALRAVVAAGFHASNVMEAAVAIGEDGLRDVPTGIVTTTGEGK